MSKKQKRMTTKPGLRVLMMIILSLIISFGAMSFPSINRNMSQSTTSTESRVMKQAKVSKSQKKKAYSMYKKWLKQNKKAIKAYEKYTNKRSVCFQDFNHDGMPDMLYCYSESANIPYLKNGHYSYACIVTYRDDQIETIFKEMVDQNVASGIPRRVIFTVKGSNSVFIAFYTGTSPVYDSIRQYYYNNGEYSTCDELRGLKAIPNYVPASYSIRSYTKDTDGYLIQSSSKDISKKKYNTLLKKILKKSNCVYTERKGFKMKTYKFNFKKCKQKGMNYKKAMKKLKKY